MSQPIGHDINGRPFRVNHRPSDESFGKMVAGLSQGNASEGIRRLLREGER